jgi:hypothetical protein
MAIRPQRAPGQQHRQHHPAALAGPVELARAARHAPRVPPPEQHAHYHRQHQPDLGAEELHRLFRRGLGDDAEMMRGDALAVELVQIDFGRQRQERGQQQEMEIPGALEYGPDGDPRHQLDGQHARRAVERLAEQGRGERHGRQQHVGNQQEQAGRAEQDAHEGKTRQNGHYRGLAAGRKAASDFAWQKCESTTGRPARPRRGVPIGTFPSESPNRTGLLCIHHAPSPGPGTPCCARFPSGKQIDRPQ